MLKNIFLVTIDIIYAIGVFIFTLGTCAKSECPKLPAPPPREQDLWYWKTP